MVSPDPTPYFYSRIFFLQGHVENEHAKKALRKADTLLSMKHGLVRLDNVWGVGGGVRPVKYLTKKIVLLLKEYLCSGDIQEATLCLNELEVPHFHHELVYEVGRKLGSNLSFFLFFTVRSFFRSSGGDHSDRIDAREDGGSHVQAAPVPLQELHRHHRPDEEREFQIYYLTAVLWTFWGRKGRRIWAGLWEVLYTPSPRSG